jgi:hypothetical protein
MGLKQMSNDKPEDRETSGQKLLRLSDEHHAALSQLVKDMNELEGANFSMANIGAMVLKRGLPVLESELANKK